MGSVRQGWLREMIEGSSALLKSSDFGAWHAQAPSIPKLYDIVLSIHPGYILRINALWPSTNRCVLPTACTHSGMYQSEFNIDHKNGCAIFITLTAHFIIHWDSTLSQRRWPSIHMDAVGGSSGIGNIQYTVLVLLLSTLLQPFETSQGSIRLYSPCGEHHSRTRTKDFARQSISKNTGNNLLPFLFRV